MEKIWKKYKVAIIVGILIIAVVITMYFVGRAAGKKAKGKTVSYDKLKVDADGNITWEGTGTFDPGPLTKALYDDMSGHNIWSLGARNMSAYQAWNSLDTQQFVAVYNYWANHYADKFGKTPVSIITKLGEEKEWSVPGWATPFTFLFGGIASGITSQYIPAKGFAALRDAILSRAKQLDMT